VDDEPAAAVQDAREVVKRAADVDVADVHVPMRMCGASYRS
jgi:hypothetical protein